MADDNRDVLIDVQNVSKRFCKDLKRSIRYGFMDSIRAIAGKSKTVTNLRKEEFWAVKDVTFQLRRGECLGLIGHNGAGKSTLLKMLNGLIRPDQGKITIRGKIGALIELGAGFNPILTGRENIYNNGAVLGFTHKEIDTKVEDIIDFAEIREFIDMPVQSYSSGMRVRLGFAVAAQMEPDVLLIDEVLAVGDAAFRVKCFNKIYELLENCAIIFVTHNMPQVSRICDRAIFMQKGQIKRNGKKTSVIIHKYFTSLGLSLNKSIQDTGKAKIGSIKLFDTQNRAINNFETGDEIRFKIHYLLKEELDELRFLIVINDENTNSVIEIRKKLLNKRKIPLGTELVDEINIDTLPLNPGKYFVTISLLSGSKGELVYVLRNACIINVFGEYVGYAPVLLHPQ